MPVTTIRGGRQIADATIPYADIQNVSANSVLVNNTASATTIQEVALAASNLLGRGTTGNIAAITASNGLEFTGTVLQTTANLRSLAGLSYSSASFVTMTATGTFTLVGTSAYATTSSLGSYLPLAGGTLTGLVTFPSAVANRPQMPGGILGLNTGDGNFDIWGISTEYYPSHATSANAWGILWNGDSNQIRFIGAGTQRLVIDLDGGSTGALTWEGNNIWHAGNLTNLNQLSNGPGYITSSSVGDGTLTLNVSGSGLSGSQTFTANQSGNATFTVTSNATDANTASTIVFRNSSGNFSAGTITASGVSTTNVYDGTGTYNVNLGSGGSEGRGLVAGYSGGSYAGIGYNVRHTATSAQWIAPGTDTSTYLLFTAGGFAFYGAGGGTAGRTLSYSTLATLNSSGTFNATNVTSGGNQVLHAGNYTSYAVARAGANRPGGYRLQRRDDDSDYSVQTYWTGTYWRLYGYNGDTGHADTYVGYADSAGSVAWGNVTSKPNEIFNYDGWVSNPGYDANTIAGNKSGFTYANNAPWTGPIAHFAASGYGLQLNATYSGGGNISYRTKNGDNATWNSWYQFIHSGNIGSQSVSYASSSGGITNQKYNISDTWFRDLSDNEQVQFYGNSRTMIYRTDGNTNDHGGGGYAHIFYYGGSADGNRVLIINTDGRLYSPYHGWLDTMSTTGNAATATTATTVSNSLTINNGGSGNGSGTSYNGGAAVTVSWNTVGALPTPRTTTTTATSTLTPDVSTGDVFTITAQNVSLAVASPTGTPYNGQKIIIRIKDNGSAKSISWTTGSSGAYRASSDLSLPITTIASKTIYLGFIWNSTDSRWDLLAKLDNF